MVAFAAMVLLVVGSFLLWLVDPRGPYWIVGAAAASLAWGIVLERRWVQVTSRVLDLDGLPIALDGLRIVHLSDIHWDAYTKPARLHAIFERINALRPDLIVLTGDLITHYRRYIEPCADGLSRLRARLGVFAVLGNHDHWANGRLLRAALEGRGIPVLMNEHRLIEGGLWLVGVDDPHLQFADLDRALEGIPDDGLPRLLLAHSPDIMSEAVGRVDLVLTGHTHGGQVRFPVVGPLLRATRREEGKRHVMGIRRTGQTVCFTNRGLGTVLIPIRFNCRPEVAVVTLRSARP
jgi:predicted MPP superfamily phosphohydrolase